MIKNKYIYIGENPIYIQPNTICELQPDIKPPFPREATTVALVDLSTNELFYATPRFFKNFRPLTPKDLLNRSNIKVKTVTGGEYITLLGTNQGDILLAIHDTEDGFLRISDYNDDLKMIHNRQYDIDSIHPDYFSHNKQILWKRE